MPSNPYFDFRASAYRFAPLTLARAAAVNARLDEVTDGFDAVKAAVDLKAPSASPTFTGDATFNTSTVAITSGTVTVPSPGPVGDESSKVPTTAWVHALMGSLSVGLPVQTGKEGMYLYTDGTSALWRPTPPNEWGGILNKPKGLVGFGLNDAQKALTVSGRGARVENPATIVFDGFSVTRHRDGVKVSPEQAFPHYLLLERGII